MSKKEQQVEKHGFFGTVIKVIMIIVFVVIGVMLITLGALSIKNNWDQIPGNNYRWLSICNIVFGCLLVTSPFFLNKKRSGINWIIKILMTIIFVVIGVLLIVGNSLAIAKNAINPQWVAIVNLVFGCLLLTSPFFLKK